VWETQWRVGPPFTSLPDCREKKNVRSPTSKHLRYGHSVLVGDLLTDAIPSCQLLVNEIKACRPQIGTVSRGRKIPLSETVLLSNAPLPLRTFFPFALVTLPRSVDLPLGHLVGLPDARAA
jgi:hypothetical protein